MALYGLTEKDRTVLRGLISNKRGWIPQRRRRLTPPGRRSDPGNIIYSGLLFEEIPTSDFVPETYNWGRNAVILENCVTIEVWDKGDVLTGGGGYVAKPYYDGLTESGEDGYEEIYRIAAINGTMSPIRGSDEIPVRVWGVLRTIHVEAPSTEYDTPYIPVDALEIIRFDPASAAGHELFPLFGNGQALWHPPGQNAYQVDGGPCGPCAGGSS